MLCGPLENLSAAFEHIGKGNYHGLVPAQGPPELTRLANGFNVMTQRLATVAAQNHRLNERLLTLQAEERADLARDLHDEIGPLLFAVDMTAATIERLAGSDREADDPAHVQIDPRSGRPDAAPRAGDPGAPAADAGDRAGRRRSIDWRHSGAAAAPTSPSASTVSIEEDGSATISRRRSIAWCRKA